MMLVILFLRVVLPLIVLYYAWKGVNYLIETYSINRNCPGCDGKGYWYSLRERVECRECKGTGVVRK